MPRTTTVFESAYRKLNDAQRQAVDAIEGPVLVLAGPGTGKTQVLTVRIANILKLTDADPGSILALTYTESAAREMKQRLVEMIGRDGYFVKIGTFHALCNEIIGDNPERFSRPAGSQNLTELERHRLIGGILEQGHFVLLKPVNAPDLFLRAIVSSISSLKREGVTPENFAELMSSLQDAFDKQKDDLSKTARLDQEKLINKNLELLEIYKQYQQKLEELGRFDFEDMINWVTQAFESDPDFLLKYQENYQYILVDEYQDTNSAQNRLVFALASYWGDKANLFVVGDPDQSIFRFQGASKENVLEFQRRFPEHIQVKLQDNYRSTKDILDSAAALLGDSPLTPTVKYKNKKINVVKIGSSILEDEFIVTSIKKKLKKGILPKDIAVIVRQNKDIDNLVDLFKQKDLPYRLEGGTDILHTPLVSQFLKLLTVITSLQVDLDDLDLFTVLNYPFLKVKSLSVLQASRDARDQRISLVDYLRHEQPEADDSLIKAFTDIVSWNSRAGAHTLPEIFRIIFQDSGLLDYILALPQPVIELNRFATLYDDAKAQSGADPTLTLFGYMENLSLMEQNGIKLEEKSFISDENAVTLTTAHKAKGLEWGVVYIYRFADTHWGNDTHRQMIKLPPGIIKEETTPEDKLDRRIGSNAEERRLFYVALTRAKKEIFITGAEQYTNSVKMTFPAMFLEDLPKENLKKLSTKNLEKKSEKILASLLAIPSGPPVHDGEAKYLKEILKDFKLSPTALNTYLYCPYKFKLDNLYRIPRAKAPAMCFGTAVHYALENLYISINNGKIESKQDFLKDFQAALNREVLTKAEYDSRLDHGKKVLSAYYDQYKDEIKPSLFTEKKFGDSISSQAVLDDIPLTGKADRIDLTNKELANRTGELARRIGGKHVRLVDYKTGQPKTRNDIEGKTKSSDGDYLRQLVFYQLLSDLDQSFQYKVVQTMIDFVEPDKQGRFHQEHFDISKDQVEDLKKLIKNSMKKIRDLDFTRTDNFDHCQRCEFKDHCWPNGIPNLLKTRG